MARQITLFTGQWADLTLDDICGKARSFGYDGVELACWGDHFEVDRAIKDGNYCKGRWDILKAHDLRAFAISNHLVGQAVCDNIDERHKSILPPDVWGDGDPEGVRQRAARLRTPSGSPSPQTSPGRIDLCRSSMLSQTAWPTR